MTNVSRSLRRRSPHLFGVLSALAIGMLAGCASSPPVPQEEPGPLPLSSPSVPIVRMVATKSTFETTFRTVYWKEGKDPVPVGDRITPLIAAFPKELQDEVDASEDVRSSDGKVLPRSLNVAWGAVVSVHPDVMIVTIRKQAPRGAPVGAYPFEAWESSANDASDKDIHPRVEDFNDIVPNCAAHISAGPLAPRSEDMWAVSTEPGFQSRRLAFENDQTTVTLPAGPLVLTRRDDRVDVIRK